MGNHRKTKGYQNSPKFFFAKFVSYFISYIVTLLAFLFCILIIISQTILNSDFLEKSIAYSKYTQALTKELKDEIMSTASLSTGMPADTFNDVITNIRVSQDTMDYFKNTLKGKNADIDTEFIRSYFSETVLERFKKHNPKITLQGENSTNYENMILSCETIYKDKITIAYFPQFSSFARTIKGPIQVCLLVLPLVCILLSLLYIPLNIRKKSRFKFVVFSSLGLFSLIIAIPISLDLSSVIERVSADGAFYIFLVKVLNDIKNEFYSMAIFTGTFAVLCMIIYYFISKKITLSPSSKAPINNSEIKMVISQNESDHDHLGNFKKKIETDNVWNNDSAPSE